MNKILVICITVILCVMLMECDHLDEKRFVFSIIALIVIPTALYAGVKGVRKLFKNDD